MPYGIAISKTSSAITASDAVVVEGAIPGSAEGLPGGCINLCGELGGVTKEGPGGEGVLSEEKRRTRAGTLPGLIWEGSPRTGCDRGLFDGKSGEPFCGDVLIFVFCALFAALRFSLTAVPGNDVLENCCIIIRSTLHR